MNELTVEWVEKAEGDFDTAGRELRARQRPNYDAACFHAQQVTEKYLKAFLQEHGQAFPKTHNLVEFFFHYDKNRVKPERQRRRRCNALKQPLSLIL